MSFNQQMTKKHTARTQAFAALLSFAVLVVVVVSNFLTLALSRPQL